ncbi:MAG TPA: pyridoxamine 5'-phosphate oxidase family protein [Acidimicrobiales bacterium]|nr:pyridoxamine 5'-phosphate oxidase family protein [Acidimicrobiales bacterium]
MLEAEVNDLASGANFAALTTMLPNGRPMTHVMWVDTDGERLLFNTEVHRRKYLNLQANPVVAVAIIDAGNPYHYVEVRGEVVEEVRGPVAREHIDALSRKYSGAPFSAPITSERVILKVEPRRQRVN